MLNDDYNFNDIEDLEDDIIAFSIGEDDNVAELIDPTSKKFEIAYLKKILLAELNLFLVIIDSSETVESLLLTIKTIPVDNADDMYSTMLSQAEGKIEGETLDNFFKTLANVWNYFPHDGLDGMSPFERMTEMFNNQKNTPNPTGKIVSKFWPLE